MTQRIALVTGSTRGIGFAIAKQLLEDGCTVIICSRKQENVANAFVQLDQSENVHPRVFHVGKIDTHEEFIQSIIEDVGLPNILVNNTTKDLGNNVGRAVGTAFIVEGTLATIDAVKQCKAGRMNIPKAVKHIVKSSVKGAITAGLRSFQKRYWSL